MNQRQFFAEMVKRRTKEINKIKSGKVSETVGNHNTDINTRSVSADAMHMPAGSGILSMSGNQQVKGKPTGMKIITVQQ